MLELRSAQYRKNRWLLAAVVQKFPKMRVVRDAYQVLADLEASADDSVGAIVRYPAVGAWAMRCLREEVDPTGLTAVALAAAHRAGRSCSFPVPAHNGWITLPSIGSHPAQGTVDVEVGPGAPAPEGWRPLPTIGAGGHTFTLDDLDPHLSPPDSVDVGPLEPDVRNTWQIRLDEAWNVLTRDYWTVRDEIATAITTLVPVGASGGLAQSSSSREAFGAIILSTPSDGVSMAETLAHENQHVKLYALMDLVALLNPDSGRRYYAPWRSDPRPARGLLNGTYAYLGVTGFWRRRMRAGDRRAEVEFAEWRAPALQATRDLLGGTDLTPTGVRFVEGMARTMELWNEEPVGAEALAKARRRREEHRASWERSNPSVRSVADRSRS